MRYYFTLFGFVIALIRCANQNIDFSLFFFIEELQSNPKAANEFRIVESISSLVRCYRRRRRRIRRHSAQTQNNNNKNFSSELT